MVERTEPRDSWWPNEPGRYDRARVAKMKPVRTAIDTLPLPLMRLRKLGAILNALEVQIENGGDSPEVNRLLLEALRAAVRHQVEEQQALKALRAIDVFEGVESKRWDQVRAGTLPPMELSAEERLAELIDQGHGLLEAERRTEACDRWLEAWELVKKLAGPGQRTTMAFDTAHPIRGMLVFNWCQDLERELGNAGHRDPTYHEHRVRYAREFLDQFPKEDTLHYVNFMRAQGESLWELGRQAESEAVYAALVERLPDEAWGYIGWADQYWLYEDSPKQYEKAEAIMKRALARPGLNDRADLLERLGDLRAEWGKPEEMVEPPQLTAGAPPDVSTWQPGFRALSTKASDSPAAARKPGRNDPCWCGSGRKYKKCHLQADEEASRR